MMWLIGGVVQTAAAAAPVDADLREPRGTKRRANLAALQIDQPDVQRCRKYLPPVQRTRTAADDAQLFDRGPASR